MGTLIALPTSELYPFTRPQDMALTRLTNDTNVSTASQSGETIGVINPGLGDSLLLSESTSSLIGKQDQGSDEQEQTSNLDRDPLAEPSPLPPAITDEPISSPLEKEVLRRHMITHSLKGFKMTVTRTPFVGEITIVTSPANSEVTFGIKRVGNREVMAHRDKNASIRYIQREGSDEYISEKDYPVGTLRVDTVALVLESWNLADANSNPVKIDKEAILSYLEPEELDFLYDEAMRINPILAGQAARKNDSSAS